jgi:TraM recognition site of TraD and TraG
MLSQITLRDQRIRDLLSLLAGRKSQPGCGQPSDTWPLDLPLVGFSKREADVWTLGDAFQGVLIMGENGSGKTSGSGELLARKYLKAGFGGLVLCFKTDEAALWQQYLRRAGREDDGRYFSADNDFRFNFMDYEAQSSGVDFAENLVTLLVDIASIQKRTEASGSEAHFWLPQKKKLIRNAIELLLMAEEPIQLRSLYSMIVSAPKDSREAADENWQRESFLFALLQHAEAKARHHPEWELITNYWMRERPALASKTRETIDADFTGMFDPLTRGKIGELFGTGTNLTPDDILEGKVVVIDIPIAKYREAGQYAALIWAQLFQRAVDRRSYEAPSGRPVFLWEDEAHYFTIEQDALFQTTARSKGISVVRLTQNLPNFLDAYGRDGKHKVDTLLGNHATKIFHRNGDPTTNEWASKVIAKETSYKHSLSNSGSLQSSSGFSSNTSVTEVEEDSCPPKEFIGLKNGGKKNDYTVEGILFQSGRLWNKSQRWTVRRFKQT